MFSRFAVAMQSGGGNILLGLEKQILAREEKDQGLLSMSD